MTLNRKFGSKQISININDLDNNTKVIFLYTDSISDARLLALTVKDSLKTINFDNIENTLLQLKNNYTIHYYDCVNAGTPSNSETKTTSSSRVYFSVIVCTKTTNYNYSGSFYGNTLYPQKNSSASENIQNYQLSNATANGNDFIIDIGISSISTGLIFSNVVVSDVMNFNFIGVSTPTVDIATSLTDCTINKNVVDANTPTVLTLTANTDNYFFNDIPTIKINDIVNNFIVSQDKKTANYTLIANENDVISVLAVAISKYINIDTVLSNCSINKTVIEINNKETIILTADNNFMFNSIPTISINGIIHNFTISQDKLTASFEYTANAGDNVTINATATKPPKTAPITKNISGCTMTPDVDSYTEYSDLTLIFKCSEYYSFNSTPYIDTNIYSTTQEQINATKINDNEYRLTMPKTPFRDIDPIYYSINVHATAIFNSETVNKYGLVLLYKPNKDILKSLSVVRFVNISSGVTEDLGQYITSLKRIYIDVESVGSANIICGKTDTKILCPMIDNDDIIIDLGNVSINGLYQNGLDNKNLDIDLILPFIGVVKLDSVIIANKTINIKYKCNLITGVCIAYIYLVENEILHLQGTYNGNIGFDVPYLLKTDSIQVYNSNVDSESIFNVPPQVKLYENAKASNNNSIYNTDLIIKIGDIPNGFFSVEKIINSNNNRIILNEELKEIENILKRGVEV